MSQREPASSDSESAPKRMNCELRRSHLLEAAIRVFARNGFRGTRTRDIAQEAGINEALLFRHYPTKDDLYAAILQQKSIDDWIGRILKALEPHAETRNDHAYFETFAGMLMDCLGAQPEFLRLMLFSALEQHEMARLYREKRVKRLLRELTQYIELRQREGAFRPMRPWIAARALTGMVKQHVLSLEVYRDVPAGVSSREVAQGFTAIFLSGMRSSDQSHE